MIRFLSPFVGLVAQVAAGIRTKLLVAFLTIAGLLIVVGVVGLQGLREVNDRTEQLIKLQRKIEAYRQVQYDTTSQLYSVASALGSSDERTLDSTLRQLNQFGYNVDRLEFVAKDEVELLEQFREDYERFIAVVARVVDLIRSGRIVEAREMQQQASPLADRLERLTSQLVNKAEADMVTGIESSSSTYATSQRLVIAFALGSIALALGLGYVISWSLIGPVKAIEARLDEIAAGDFTRHLNVVSRDELGVLAANVNRMSEELRQRTDDLTESLEQQTATADVLGVISSSTGDLKPVFDVILANAVKICGAGFGNLSLYDGKDLRMAAMHNAPFAFQEQRRSDPVIPRSNSIGGSVIAKRQVIHVHDMAAEEPYCHSMLAKKADARSALGVPMLRDDTLVGMISIYRQAVHPFSDKQIALVQNFAAQAVIAIENARLLNELRQRTDDLSKSLDDLRMAQASLVHAQKMAALGQLTAGIAHEIKNPLNFVNNFASLSVELLDELKEAARAVGALDPGKHAEIVETIGMLTGNMEKIVEHGRRADGIVRSMLQHSRGGSDDWQPTDLNALVEEALNLAYHGARAQDPNFNITLEHDLDRNLAPVDAVPQELTRVLLNLISNGFYAANKRSREGDRTYRPALKVTTRGSDGSVEVRVRDNGIGIPPEDRDKLFQPFFTTKPTGEGTGLGLSISYEIVTQQHGGTISVHSEVGDFTEFTVRLPRSRSAVSGRMG